MQAIRPTRLEIFLTNRCNLRCTYCSSRHITARTARTLSLPDLRRAVDLFEGYGRPGKARDAASDRTICFTGGEPLLEFNLLKDIISYIRGRKERFAVTVNTNATLLTPEMAEFLLAQGVYLAVSLDGGRDVHDLHRVFKDDRRASVYDAMLGNLRALPAEFLKQVRASVTITSRTMPAVIETVGLLQDMGFRFVELGLDSYEIWTPAKLKVLEKTLSAVRDHYVGLLNSGDAGKIGRVFTFSLENKQAKAGFYTPMNDVSLSPDGVFYPSDTLATAASKDGEFAIGDLERGIDFAKTRRIYARAAANIPPGLRAEGAFSPVDRYLYCLAHGLPPASMLADAARANRIFTDRIGGFLEVQRVYRDLARNAAFGDLAHGPKYRNAKDLRSLRVAPAGSGSVADLRKAADYFLYSGQGRKTIVFSAPGGRGAFGDVEAAALYAALKARMLGKGLRLAVEAESL